MFCVRNSTAVGVLALLASSMFTSACVKAPPPTLHFEKPGANQQAFMEDRYGCIQSSQQARTRAVVDRDGGVSNGAIVTSRSVFLSCMGAKGYQLTERGPLSVPPSSEVRLVE